MFDDPRLPESFWERVIPEPNTGCWLWLGGRAGDGSGKYHVGGCRYQRAHSFLYRALVDSRFDRDVIRTCGERLCCNPDHLRPERIPSGEDRLAYQREWKRKTITARPEYRKRLSLIAKASYEKHLAGRRDRARRAMNAKYPVIRAKQIEKLYGLTVADVDAMLAAQSNLCAVCSEPFGATTKTRWNIDHCHSTGVVRGLLCTRCNLGVGNFRDNETFLENAIAYLKNIKKAV